VGHLQSADSDPLPQSQADSDSRFPSHTSPKIPSWGVMKPAHQCSSADSRRDDSSRRSPSNESHKDHRPLLRPEETTHSPQVPTVHAYETSKESPTDFAAGLHRVLAKAGRCVESNLVWDRTCRRAMVRRA